MDRIGERTGRAADAVAVAVGFERFHPLIELDASSGTLTRLRILLLPLLLGVSSWAAAGGASVALPLASATRVPADRAAHVSPPDATSRILVKREGGSDIVAMPQSIFLDGREVATLDERQYVTFDIAPGHHDIGIRDARTGSAPTTLGITAGAHADFYFRISQDAKGSVVFQLSSGPDD